MLVGDARTHRRVRRLDRGDVGAARIGPRGSFSVAGHGQPVLVDVGVPGVGLLLAPQCLLLLCLHVAVLQAVDDELDQRFPGPVQLALELGLQRQRTSGEVKEGVVSWGNVELGPAT